MTALAPYETGILDTRDNIRIFFTLPAIQQAGRPERIRAIILAGVTKTRWTEIGWLYNGLSIFLLKASEEFTAAIPEALRPPTRAWRRRSLRPPSVSRMVLDKVRDREHLGVMINTRTTTACSYFWAFL